MFKVGLTGGIGSGKSTVAQLFTGRKITVIDSDRIAREVVEPGSSGLSQIVDKFGESILSNGNLDRQALRQKVFSNQELLSWLNQLLHPLIRQRSDELVSQAHSPYVILDIPLLFENHLESSVDRILVIDVDEETQYQRVMARDTQTRKQVAAIISRQVNRQYRLEHTDDIIDNSREADLLPPAVDKLHTKYLELANNV